MIRNLAFLAPLVASAALAAPRESYPIEPVAIPPSIRQGVDLIYIDPEIAPATQARDALLDELGIENVPGAAVDLFLPISPLYTDLRRGLSLYRSDWSGLPQLQVEAGPALRKGAAGPRVAQLRGRLGLPEGDRFGDDLDVALRRFQQAHGLRADGVAGAHTVTVLNLGAEHFERLLLLNLERAKVLPGPDEQGRYILIDGGEARLYMYEGGQLQDSMKVIVGKQASPTPMMAALIRYANVNPYWNVPPDLVQTLIAPRVLAEGLTYFEAEGYDVLSDWSDTATVLDPAGIDWASVARGELELRIRQRPGTRNFMGDIKFMMPNDFGIYLHDTPGRHLFEASDRWISNGCVRVEDARRLARWLFGEMPAGDDPAVEQRVELETPVPVYITYLTAVGTGEGVEFRDDPYRLDTALLARQIASAR